MKRLLALLLVVCVISFPVCASAQTGLLGSLGDFLGDALDGAGQVAEDALNGAGELIDEAGESINGLLGDAGETIDKLWNDTKGYAAEAWDWTEAFVQDQGNAIAQYAVQAYADMGNWLSITGEGALDILKEVFNVVTANVGIASDKAAELWDAIYQYSIEKNISFVVLVKLAIAIIIRVSLGGDILIGEMAGDYINEIVLGWFSEFNINSEEDAEKALEELEKSVDAVPAEN